MITEGIRLWIFILVIHLLFKNVKGEKNVAYMKPTNQTTIVYEGDPSRAVDGDPNPNYSANSCSHTNVVRPGETYNWWCVDLEQSVNITNITVVNRDVNQFLLQGFIVKTRLDGICNGEGFSTASECFKDTSTRPQDRYTVTTCNNARTVYIGVQKVLTLCEVFVYKECSSTCLNGCDGNDVCFSCVSDYYGDQCQKLCPANCKSGCQQNNGVCYECKPPYFGLFCNQTCSDGCLPDSQGLIKCQQVDAYCNNGCIAGRYGNKCDLICSLCNGTCDRTSGRCDLCIVGRYGVNCDRVCSLCNGPCDRTSGRCDQCIAGRYGENCDQICNQCSGPCERTSGRCDQCIVGRYDVNCDQICNQCDGPCNRTSGICDQCIGGKYGRLCNSSCSKFCMNELCERVSGNCTNGCTEGRGGVKCQIVSGPQDMGDDIGTLIPAIVVPVIVILILIVIIIMFIKRRKKLNKNIQENHVREKPLQIEKPSQVYENYNPELNAENPEVAVPTLPAAVTYANGSEGVEYQNVPDEVKPTTRIDLSKLMDYVKNKTKEEFKKEYEELPDGLCEPHSVGLNTVNKHKNRYRNICAYDATRVKLEPIDGDPDTDYMNACYINRYNGDRCIASQGTNKANLLDFVRMIWDVNASKIVMVTNLTEAGKDKCKQYWGDDVEEGTFGQITVDLSSVKVFAHYTIREFKVSKEGCEETRTVYQYHYTDWPDKDVPDDIISLLDFIKVVQDSTGKQSGPMIVHCSAGIGRTGTFLVLDYLLAEGKKLKSVDVFQCVNRMRHERVNMVQTLNQYIFIHQCLVYWYIATDTTLTMSNFSQVAQNLLKINNNTSKLQLKYQLLTKIRLLDDEKQYSSAGKLKENQDKNRDQTILANDLFRPHLKVTNPDTTNYINAVYVSTLNKKFGMIVTQTPLHNTVNSFWKMIVECQVRVVIDLESNCTDETIGRYLIENEPMDHQPYQISIQGKPNSSDIYEVINYQINDEPLKIYRCKFWKENKSTPTTAQPLFELYECIKENLSNSEMVVVHCLNGARRSGLFSVMVAMLEKFNKKKEVNVLQTILQQRVIRPQFITSFDQLKFCVEAMNEYIDTSTTYVNA